MSTDTISKIKLRLNNNLKVKQSKDQTFSALSNRMYANSQTSDCNDFLANCCNCCDPPTQCVCCPCLAGFLISITGWEDGTCDCSGLNVTTFVPRITCGTYERQCELHGASMPQGVYPNYTCPDPEGINVSGFVCSGGQFPGIWWAGVSWELYCIDGQLYLKVYHASNKSLTVGVIGGEPEYINGFAIWSTLFTPFDCEDLEVSGGLAGGCSPECICTGITFTATPVFGGPLTPPECQCCRPERCESIEPGCLNPFPDSFLVNITDNCSGSIITSLTRSGNCWEGSYGTMCPECVGDDISMFYIVEMNLCCNNGNWEFTATVIDPDACQPISWKSDPNIITDGTALMNVDSCNPMSFSSDSGYCGICEWRTCSSYSQYYCVISFTITE